MFNSRSEALLKKFTLFALSGWILFGAGNYVSGQTPAFTSWNTNFWTVTSTSGATKSIWVSATGADRLTLANNTGPNLSANSGNPDPSRNLPGVINFVPGSSASTSTYTVTLSNSISQQSTSTNLTIVVGPLKPLQIRVVDLRSDTTQPFQILPVDTGDTQGGGPTGSSFWYVNGAGTNPLTNGYSVAKTSLPSGTTNNSYTAGSVPFYTMFVSNVSSGTLWIAYTDEAFTNALTKGNPGGTAASTVQWSQVPFGEVEYSYTGGGYDTADMTFINVISVPTMLRFSSNGATTLQGPKGVTNSTALVNTVSNLWSQPGIAWYGAVTSTVAGQPNTNIIRLVGPASATKGGVQMPSGGAMTNATNPQVITAGNYVDGWPGFSAASLSQYVSSVAANTTNNGLVPGTSTPWGRTKIHKQIGDPGAAWSGGSQWYFTAELTFVPNTNPISSNWSSLYTNYLTPIPVLTNITITNVWISKTDANDVTTNGYAGGAGLPNVSVQFTPDSGHPTNSWFSSYIYNAPPSFNAGVNTGYATFYVNGQTNEAWWTGLASYLNSGQSRTASANFTAYVLDAFLNEIAFGFNAGFVQSPVKGWTNGWTYNASGGLTGNTNTGSPDTVIGLMNSDQWWDQTNGLYRNNRGTPDDGFYCTYGNGVFQIGETIYSHAISDRMRYVGFSPGMPLSEANTNNAAIMEIYIRDVALPATPTGPRPTVTGISTNGVLSTSFYQYQPQTWSGSVPSPHMPTNTHMIVLQMTNAGPGPTAPLQPQVQFPSFQVQAANTNGGGVYVGSLPAGLTWDPANLTITGTLVSPDNTNNTGSLNFGLSPYSSNDATITTVPLYVLPVDTTPYVTNVTVTNTYPRPPHVAAVAFPGETITLQGTNFLNYGGSVAPVNQVVFANGLATTNFTILDNSNITVTVPTNWTTTTGFVGSVAAQRVWTNTAAHPPTVITNGAGWSTNFGIPMPLVTGFASTGGGAITGGSPGSSVVLQGFFYGVTNVTFLANAASATNVPVATPPAYPYTNLMVTVPTPSGSLPQGGTVAVDVVYNNLTSALSTNASSTSVFNITAAVEKPAGPLSSSSSGIDQFEVVLDPVVSFSEIFPWGSVSPPNLMLQVANYTTAMTTDAQASYAATGLPRGLWVTNVVQGQVVNGYIIGAPIDTMNSGAITVTASNSAGSTNLTFNLTVNSSQANVAPSPPSISGPISFNATQHSATNLLVDYTNSPTYFEVSDLPAGMSFGPIIVVTYPFPETHAIKDGHFALGITGAPTASGTFSVTVKAVNVTSSGPTTNTSNITIIVAPSGGGEGGGGSGLATWGGGSLPALGTAAYSNALLQYAFGGSASYGAAGTQTNFGTASLSNVSGIDYLILREIIRTNDANLTVWSEHTTNLTNTSWTSNSIQPVASADQSQATPGVNQVQEFRAPQGSDQRKFLRLKATYQTP